MIVARNAKRSKLHRRLSAAAKRTKVGQTIGGKEAFEVSIEDLTVTITPSKKTLTEILPKKPIKKIKKAVKRRKRTVKAKIAARKIEFKTIVTDVISPRGRPTFAAAPTPGQPQTPQDIFTTSTAIAAYRYSPTQRILQIDFVKGGTYNYFNVPRFTVMALGRAQSKGRYFYYNIRTTFQFQRVS